MATSKSNVRLETSGRPEMEPMERNVQRALNGIRGEYMAGIPYTPPAGVFDDPQPTTLQEALNRALALIVSSHTTIP